MLYSKRVFSNTIQKLLFSTKMCIRDSSSGVHHGSSSHTSYYVTFEFESKDRTEFRVNGKEYGMIAEGDYGKLKFQGTRFLEFNRI